MSGVILTLPLNQRRIELGVGTKETYQPIPAAVPNVATGQNNYSEDQQQWMDMISDMLGDFGPTYQSSNVA